MGVTQMHNILKNKTTNILCKQVQVVQGLISIYGIIRFKRLKRIYNIGMKMLCFGKLCWVTHVFLWGLLTD